MSLRLFHQEAGDRYWVEVQSADLMAGPNQIVAPLLPEGHPLADRTGLRVPVEHPLFGASLALVDLLRPVGRGTLKLVGKTTDQESYAIREVLQLIFDL